MANNIQTGQIYNHFLTAYAPKELTRADTHKKDELRGIYNSIVKISKESPLYLLTKDSSVEEDAIGIKESARGLQGTLTGLEDDSENALFAKKSAFTSDGTMVSANYIGGDRAIEEVPTFQIEVDHLATRQRNVGRFLPQDSVDLQSGGYSFNVRVNDLNYEFQYSVRNNDSNQDVQQRLERLINKSNIGLSAEIETDENGRTALAITSNDFGIPLGKQERFAFSESAESDMLTGTVDYFGMDRTQTAASNATFILDGKERVSTSNHFTVASMYELQLLREKEEGDEPVTVGVKDDNASVVDRTKELVSGYNAFIDSIKSFQNAHFKGSKITNEVTGIAKQYNSALQSLGIGLTEDGHIELDSGLLAQSAAETDVKRDFQPVKDFANALQDKMDQIILDPMHYIDRPVVAYKNPGHGIPNPYITSEYSGMMFNGYC